MSKQLQAAVVMVCATLLAIVVVQSPPPSTLAASGSIRVDPATTNASAGSSFSVKLVQTADVVTTGAQATITFDPVLLSITDVAPGSAYSAATLLMGVAPQTKADAIAEANSTGVLKNVATFFIPGTGSAPSGDAEFLNITMQAKAGGTAQIQLSTIEMIDDQGSPVAATGTGGSVTIGGTAPPAGATPPPLPAGSPTVAATAPAAGSTPSAASTGETIGTPAGTPSSGGTASADARQGFSFSPNSTTAAKGEIFSVDVRYRADTDVTSASVQIKMDSELVEVVAIKPGTAWEGSQGSANTLLETALSQAAETGSVEVSFLLSGATAPAGEGSMMTLEMRALDADGVSPLEFVSYELLGADGSTINASAEDGQVIVGSGGASSSSLTTMLLLLLIALVVAGTSGGVYFVKQRRQRQWA